jgi:hypothetical protein
MARENTASTAAGIQGATLVIGAGLAAMTFCMTSTGSSPGNGD